MNKNQDSLTIDGLAKAAGIGVETIRYFQRRALLPEPGRPLGGICRYGTADVQRIVFIKSAQRLGFSLDEVADLLKLADSRQCDEVRTLAEHKLEDVQQRIAELRRMEMALQELIGRCQTNQNEASCPLSRDNATKTRHGKVAVRRVSIQAQSDSGSLSTPFCNCSV